MPSQLEADIKALLDRNRLPEIVVVMTRELVRRGRVVDAARMQYAAGRNARVSMATPAENTSNKSLL